MRFRQGQSRKELENEINAYEKAIAIIGAFNTHVAEHPLNKEESKRLKKFLGAVKRRNSPRASPGLDEKLFLLEEKE